MTPANIPPISPAARDALETIAGLPEVQKALEYIHDRTDAAIRLQVELCEIPAPTFNKRTSNLRTIEQNRARLYADVHDDVAVRKLWVWCGDVRAFVWAFRL